MSESKTNQHDGPSSAKLSTITEYHSLLEAARRERPDPLLTPRVLSRLSYRAGLYDPADRNPKRWFNRWWLAGSVAAALAVVATGALFARSHPYLWRSMRLASAEFAAVPTLAPGVAVGSGAATAVAPAAVTVVRDPCVHKRVGAGRESLIDDFEDGDDQVAPLEGRSGLWRWVRDTDRPGSAPILLPIPQPRPTARNQQALHVKGARLLDWGASVEFTFQPACYDASAYLGITFRAKGPGRIYLAAREVRLIPPEGEGTCQANDCYNVHVKKFDLTERYATYEARWYELQQRGYGRPAVDPTQLNSIAFFVRPEDTPYDLWIDDVKFVE